MVIKGDEELGFVLGRVFSGLWGRGGEEKGEM